jgi:hypothetical protein
MDERISAACYTGTIIDGMTRTSHSENLFPLLLLYDISYLMAASFATLGLSLDLFTRKGSDPAMMATSVG